eukprot:JP448310.1.p1 GENE.JP448310.1~~JP448310.1.p1  ORF type:complete len:138 (+),score=44.32 JP448310.1:1-414(+)
MAYGRWSDIYPIVAEEIAATEEEYFIQAAEMEVKALALHKEGRNNDLVQLVTTFAVDTADTCVTQWLGLWQKLFATFRDGQITTPDPEVKRCNCKVVEPGYSTAWYDRIVKDTGTHYKVAGDTPPDEVESLMSISGI